MKFVYIGYDFMLDVVHRLLGDGHELVAICSFPCDNRFSFNVQAEALAAAMQIDFTTAPISEEHIAKYKAEGAECFFSAGYPYKIPLSATEDAYGINVHPTLLPKGRSLLPAPHILLSHPEDSGVTIHKLAERIDAGDILLQEPVAIRDDESVETLSARTILKTVDLAARVFQDMETYYQNAKPQNDDDATHWDTPTDVMRTLDWQKPVKQISKIQRAFGYYGSLAFFNDEMWNVYDADVWEEDHSYAPGDVVANLGTQLVIAAKDGFVCLKLIEKIHRPD